jgi:hypothetical protein
MQFWADTGGAGYSVVAGGNLALFHQAYADTYELVTLTFIPMV